MFLAERLQLRRLHARARRLHRTQQLSLPRTRHMKSRITVPVVALYTRALGVIAQPASQPPPLPLVHLLTAPTQLTGHYGIKDLAISIMQQFIECTRISW